MSFGTVHLRAVWGLVDISATIAEGGGYDSSSVKDAGPSAAAGVGVGVRRCTLVIDRTAAHAGADPATMHFDFMNMTGGDPDDTWTTGDYTTEEAHLDAFWNTVRTYVPVNYKLARYVWHRVGTGVPHPNPAERDFAIASPVGGSASGAAPQVASTLTIRTGFRRNWGRTYLPIGAEAIGTGYKLTTTAVDALAGALDTLYSDSAGDDFVLGVTSIARSSFLGLEASEVDDVPDVIRRRRWQVMTYRNIIVP